jgi:hypothetical protein
MKRLHQVLAPVFCAALCLFVLGGCNGDRYSFGEAEKAQVERQMVSGLTLANQPTNPKLVCTKVTLLETGTPNTYKIKADFSDGTTQYMTYTFDPATGGSTTRRDP